MSAMLSSRPTTTRCAPSWRAKSAPSADVMDIWVLAWMGSEGATRLTSSTTPISCTAQLHEALYSVHAWPMPAMSVVQRRWIVQTWGAGNPSWAAQRVTNLDNDSICIASCNDTDGVLCSLQLLIKQQNVHSHIPLHSSLMQVVHDLFTKHYCQSRHHRCTLDIDQASKQLFCLPHTYDIRQQGFYQIAMPKSKGVPQVLLQERS